MAFPSPPSPSLIVICDVKAVSTFLSQTWPLMGPPSFLPLPHHHLWWMLIFSCPNQKDAEDIEGTAPAWAHAPHWSGLRKPGWCLVLTDDKSNRNMKISEDYGVLIEEEGIALRGKSTLMIYLSVDQRKKPSVFFRPSNLWYEITIQQGGILGPISGW
ncbi:hypothetical protein DFH29DRAFT_995341 [Suillus ampliporus]|nr:hypothetical protein DFH29DRAFT_995341 [Suillus ampliporus]